MWNGINYILKIPTDLDYLGQYRAISNWLGFDISRNPFCIPYPMEEGAAIFSSSKIQDKTNRPIATTYINHPNNFV
jgi:hypothetical protein